MIILAEGAPASFEKRYAGNPHVGHLLTPRSLNVEAVLKSGLPWGVDCESVRGWEPDPYFRLMEKLSGTFNVPRPYRAGSLRFFAIPPMAVTAIARRGLLMGSPVISPGVYYVLEELFAGLVVAGNARWRQGDLKLHLLIKQAREMGKWVHARDVCSFRQARAMAAIGCSSCSLPHYARFKYKDFEPLVEAAAAPVGTRSLF